MLTRKVLFLLCLFCCAATMAFGQYPSGQIKAFVSEGYTMYHQVAGDLNKDSLVDLAIVLEKEEANAEGEKDRSLLLLLKNNKTDNTYSLVCQADHVILNGQSGGTLGDPFAKMEIGKNGVLRIDFEGGSREKWSTTHRYRYNKNAFYVIGATISTQVDNITETHDYNVATGLIVDSRKDAANKANNKSTTRNHKIQPPELSRFEPDAIWGILTGEGVKTVNCKLTGAGSGDCYHLEFDCGDFGGAETYFDQATMDLWSTLTVAAPADDIQPNPAYDGTVFEIRYVEKTGVKCEEQGPAPYQLVIGFRKK